MASLVPLHARVALEHPAVEIDSMFHPGGSAARSHGHRAQEPVGTPPPGGSTVGTTPTAASSFAADASGGGAGEPSVVVGVPACFPLMAPLEEQRRARRGTGTTRPSRSRCVCCRRSSRASATSTPDCARAHRCAVGRWPNPRCPARNAATTATAAAVAVRARASRAEPDLLRCAASRA